jgi:flagellar biosynthesis/type III secretory pathway M-ring protein FliF/YscJ
MNAIIVIEIVVGIVILAAAVRFAVRDIRQRSASDSEQGAETVTTTEAPACASEPEPAQQLSEVGSTEAN